MACAALVVRPTAARKQLLIGFGEQVQMGMLLRSCAQVSCA
jgi:hypothetical protein